MKNLLILYAVSLLLVASCSKPKDEEVPSYLQIDSVSFNPGSTIHEDSSLRIPDVWVTVNQQFVGAFEMPTTIPVLDAGKSKIVVRAGVKENGISATRVIYPFYKPFVIDTTLVRQKTLKIKPRWTYIDNVNTALKENFEGFSNSFLKAPGNTSDVDTSKLTDSLYGGTFCMRARLSNGKDKFMAFCKNNFTNFSAGKAVWLEVYYKTDVEITTGLFIVNTKTAVVEQRDMVVLSTTQGKWRKIYINFTSAINEYLSQSSNYYFNVFMYATGTDKTVYLDNLKILYL